MNTVYLDNNATTAVAPEVLDAMLPYFGELYGNPSSMHTFGGQVAEALETARERLAALLGADPDEVLFTSCGSESDNAAIWSALQSQPERRHIITTRVEHPAVLSVCRYWERQGYRVTMLGVDARGRLDLEEYAAALGDDTAIVSVMFANNEVGNIYPIQRMAEMAKERGILFHTDAVQGFGKYHIYPKRLGIDMLSASGHKIHGPKGTGFLYLDEKVKILPIVFGGEQQKNIRSGTENVPGIAGLSLAAEMIYRDLDVKVALMRDLKAHFLEGVSKIEHTTVHGLTDENSAPHIISVGFAGIRSEVLLHALEEKGIYVSSGSACASNHPAVSGVLKGIGASKEYLDATLRFSMSEFTTREEVDYTLETLYDCIPKLRKYTRH